MLLSVNPTRMELLRLRERLVLAEKGHKLLKDKLEGLMRNFIEVSTSFVEKRAKFDQAFNEIRKKYYASVSSYDDDELEEMFFGSNMDVNISSRTASIMNVKYPIFSIDYSGCPFAYPLTFTRSELDSVFLEFLKLLPSIAELASLQQEIYLTAMEIAKIRRRVNALEYVMIPNLEETIKYINQKLEEMDRENIARLLKIKDIIRNH
ncbi:MAG: V-type ATP synthase subunit D [Caldisericaceae bacterium]